MHCYGRPPKPLKQISIGRLAFTVAHRLSRHAMSLGFNLGFMARLIRDWTVILRLGYTHTEWGLATRSQRRNYEYGREQRSLDERWSSNASVSMSWKDWGAT